MSYVDLAIGLGFFLFFIAVVMGLSVQYFVKVPVEQSVEEYIEIATDMFERFFSSGGTPNNWEDSADAPSELGLVQSIYKISVTARELAGTVRTDEPLIVRVVFDEECSKNIWNNTIRVYNSTLYEHEYEFVDSINCSGQYLNESYIRFEINISQNEEKLFYVFYSDDTDIPAPNYTISYSTSSWTPLTGDTWTDTTSGWYIYGGSGVSPGDNETNKIMGTFSVQIKDTFSSANVLGLRYQPTSPLTGVSNGLYMDSWIYVDDLTGVSSVNITISEGNDMIMSSIDSSSMDNGVWYHFEKNLTSSEWEDWSSFDASNEIDNITFYMVNSSAGITRQLNVDEVHFEVRPLSIKTFPEEREEVISSKKVSALNNLTYSQLRDVTGEDYRFRVEIIE